ncbi:hypothetical protein O6H91_10G003800 [Diphasiastrum complanatum]|uniref:Uncharacterized protein n=1 Tax=Diphasiastrum complanatum TaxID=34168 RepID=A0ACC2CDT2_DIPCM|nr:hypothetical protein O6H91_10G003800 [Diphasiastrum complanatum]
MGPIMKFQVVVLAGGMSKKLFPLVSKDVPKALLPVGNRPVLSYVLELLEANNLKDLIVVVAGEDAAVRVGGWITEAYDGRLHVEVAAVSEDIGTADALRAVLHRLVVDDVLVVSGDIVSDVPLGAIAAAHRRKRAVLTAMLCSSPSASTAEAISSTGKDKAKKPSPIDIVGLDTSHQHLLFLASGTQVDKDVKIRRSLIRVVDQMEIHMDLMDAHLYAFNRAILQEVLELCQGIKSIKQDLVPYLVRSQSFGAIASGDTQTEAVGKTPNKDDSGQPQTPMQDIVPLPQHILPGVLHPASLELTCCVYIASEGKYCSRVNSIQTYGDINRDQVAGELVFLTGYTVSNQNNVIHPTAEIGSKTTVGPQCMVGDGSKLGDKCSVKKSIVGRHCRIGSNVKIINSVVMNHVTVEDGCLIQGSVICSNVHLQERANLKDCQVGAGYIITANSEHKAEALSKREKS